MSYSAKRPRSLEPSEIFTEQQYTTVNILRGANGHSIPITRVDIVLYTVNEAGEKIPVQD
jgi:hypothetical protein